MSHATDYVQITGFVNAQTKFGLALFVYCQNICYIQKVSEEGVRKKIKFVVKLILFYMNIHCYITFKKTPSGTEP